MLSKICVVLQNNSYTFLHNCRIQKTYVQARSYLSADKSFIGFVPARLFHALSTDPCVHTAANQVSATPNADQVLGMETRDASGQQSRRQVEGCGALIIRPRTREWSRACEVYACYCIAGMVGLGRLELPTSPLSGVRSSHLSYRPSVADSTTRFRNAENAARLPRSTQTLASRWRRQRSRKSRSQRCRRQNSSRVSA